MKNKSLTIILGCYYLKDDESYILNKYYKKSICVSNEQYEKRLFNGFLKTAEDFIFVSAPRVGGFPISSKKMTVRGFTENEHLRMVKYLSPFGMLNWFKTKAMIKKVKQILKSYDEPLDIHLIACEAHRPYLEVIKYFKKHRHGKNVFSTLIAPDVPSDMKRSKHLLYSVFRNRDIKKIQLILDNFVDSFLCFTKPIDEKLNTLHKKSIIFEGIIEEHLILDKHNEKDCHVVYIGKTDKRNGVELILEASKLTPKNFVFDIYGSGDMDDKLRTLSYDNVIYHGFVEPSTIDNIIENADILLSPRFPDEEYVKNSFPSKIFEYLSFKKKIITFHLPCYFKELDNFLIYPKGYLAEDLAKSIIEVEKQNAVYSESAFRELLDKYSPENVVRSIISLRSRIDE